jgi:hypothetical protein
MHKEEWKKLLKKARPTQGCRANDDDDDDDFVLLAYFDGWGTSLLFLFCVDNTDFFVTCEMSLGEIEVVYSLNKICPRIGGLRGIVRIDFAPLGCCAV